MKTKTLEECVKIINKNTVMVNLDAPSLLPFDGAQIESNLGGTGWVKVERKGDDIYVEDEKIDFFLSEAQKREQTVQGHELRKLVPPGVHPNIMDALVDLPHMIPEKYKQDDKRRTRYLFSFVVVYRPSDGDLYVRFWYWSGGAWQRGYRWLDRQWGVQYPALVLASPSSLSSSAKSSELSLEKYKIFEKQVRAALDKLNG